MAEYKRYLRIDPEGKLTKEGVLFVSSVGPYDMALENAVGETNRQNFFSQVGICGERLARMRVQHGVAMEKVVKRGIYPCDGLFTPWRIALAVLTADCFPVLMVRKEPRMIALLHCGWRGAVEELPLRFLHQAWSLDYRDPKLIDVHVAFGPGICGEHYLVTNPVQLTFGKDSRALWMKFMKLKDPEMNLWAVDLAGYMKFRLAEHGVPQEQIFTPHICTWEYWEKGLLPCYQRGDRERRFLTVAMMTR